MNSTDWYDRLATDGYAVLSGVLSLEEVAEAIADCIAALSAPAATTSLLVRPGGEPHGARNLLRLWPAVVGLARTPILIAALRRILGPQAGLVRGLYFDKPPGDGWTLPWHRDTTIAVQQHLPHNRFGKPTVKSGVPHVEGSPELLSNMISARIHLDPMTDENGPLRVVPGSHVDGSVSGSGISLHCEAGDVVLMRPLLLHASAGCSPEHRGHRRVVHLEFAAHPTLPDGYEWHTFIPVSAETD